MFLLSHRSLLWSLGAFLLCAFCAGTVGILWFLALGPGAAFGPLVLVGGYLVQSFSYAAFFVPLYLLAMVPLLLLKPFRLDRLILLNSLILPFLTLALCLRLLFDPRPMDSPVTAAVATAFTVRGGALLAGLALAAELSLLPSFSRFLSMIGRRADNKIWVPEPAKGEQAADEAASSSYGSDPADSPGSEQTDDFDDPDSAELVEAEVSEMPDGTIVPSPGGSVDDAGEEAPGGNLRFRARNPAAAADPTEAAGSKPEPAYNVPPGAVLNNYDEGEYWVVDEETRRSSDILKATLEEFRIQAEVTGIRKGPVITMFEILPAPGVKLSRIVNLADNIALRLAASSVRIVAPIPGKHAVGIEVPNKKRAIVSFAEMTADDRFSKAKMEIPIALGKDISGEAQIIDLTHTPHLLIAGATGSGKSVCVNSIICSILFLRPPREVRLILIDPKIVELKFYNDIPHLLTPVITEPKRAFQALQYAISEMERRYTLLDSLGVRDIKAYNKRVKQRSLAVEPIPYLVLVVDEFADLMATTGKELESTLARLAAMSRAVGIHLVLATQRPSIDVITGLIKANIPSRIAFMVASKFDSRIIVDAVGAEKLLGRGDLLLSSAWNPFPVRMQGAFVSEEEVERIVDHVKSLGKPDYIDDEIFYDDEEEDDYFEDAEDDPIMDKALEIIRQTGKASASYLQRRLKIGYNRAARLVENLERRGVLGPQNGSKPREILSLPD